MFIVIDSAEVVLLVLTLNRIQVPLSKTYGPSSMKEPYIQICVELNKEKSIYQTNVFFHCYEYISCLTDEIDIIW